MPKDALTGDLFSGAAAAANAPAPAAPAVPATAPLPDTPPDLADLAGLAGLADLADLAGLAGLAARLDASSDYRVLRRFVPRDGYVHPISNPAHALFIDLETTGLDFAADQIIELSAVPFSFDSDSGEVGAVGQPCSSLEDPGRPIPEVAKTITGITDEMVRGRRIDDASVLALLAASGLVLSHNAAFDRPFLERRLPAFAKTRWACSMSDVDWKVAGYGGRGLEILLIQHCRAFFDAHRAELDCRAGIHLLATPFGDGSRPMQQLLRNATANRSRISAIGAPFDAKDLLRARGYRWFAGDAERSKAWYRIVASDTLDAERAWLTEKIYSGKYRAKEEEQDPLRRFMQ